MAKGSKKNPPDRFVVFRLSSLGDVVLTTGLLNFWHEARGWRFVVVTRDRFAPLFKDHPAVDRVVALEDQDLTGPAWRAKAGILAVEFLDHGLIDLHGTIRSGILVWSWKGPTFSYPKFGLLRRAYLGWKSGFLSQRLSRYNVPQRYSLALEQEPPALDRLRPKIYPTPEELAWADKMLSSAWPDRSEASDAAKPLVALHPYAAHPDKTWPLERWKDLLERIKAAGWDFFAIGLGQGLGTDHPADFTGQTELREVCALLARADLLITGDSGPMHLASAVGCPVLAMFGPTTRAWGFYPFGPRDRVLEVPLKCRPCSLHGRHRCRRGLKCLMDISPEQVLKNAQDMLGQ